MFKAVNTGERGLSLRWTRVHATELLCYPARSSYGGETEKKGPYTGNCTALGRASGDEEGGVWWGNGSLQDSGVYAEEKKKENVGWLGTSLRVRNSYGRETKRRARPSVSADPGRGLPSQPAGLNNNPLLLSEKKKDIESGGKPINTFLHKGKGTRAPNHHKFKRSEGGTHSQNRAVKP